MTGYGNSERMETLKLYVPKDGEVGIPRSYFCSKIKDLTKIKDCRTVGPKVNLPFLSTLRQNQVPVAEAALAKLEEYPNGGIINMPCGGGKTVVGLYCAHRIGLKTLVIVHTSKLFVQWQERIEEHTGIQCGLIREDLFDIDAPIVVAMLQTLLARNYDMDDFKDFGVTLSDEVHRLAAPTWCAVIPSLPMT